MFRIAILDGYLERDRAVRRRSLSIFICDFVIHLNVLFPWSINSALAAAHRFGFDADRFSAAVSARNPLLPFIDSDTSLKC